MEIYLQILYPHIYQSPELYDVKLIASDGQGCIDTTIFVQLH